MMNWRKLFHFFVLAAVLTEIVEPTTPFVRIFIDDGNHKYSTKNVSIQDTVSGNPVTCSEGSHPQTQWIQEEEIDARSKSFQPELTAVGSSKDDFDEASDNHHSATALLGVFPLGPPLFSRHVGHLFSMQTHEYSRRVDRPPRVA